MKMKWEVGVYRGYLWLAGNEGMEKWKLLFGFRVKGVNDGMEKNMETIIIYNGLCKDCYKDSFLTNQRQLRLWDLRFDFSM